MACSQPALEGLAEARAATGGMWLLAVAQNKTLTATIMHCIEDASLTLALHSALSEWDVGPGVARSLSAAVMWCYHQCTSCA
jgi:hypothetical protein